MNFTDELERITSNLSNTSATLIDPNNLKTVVVNMSRTYSDSVHLLIDIIKAAAVEVEYASGLTLIAASKIGMSLDGKPLTAKELQIAYTSTARGGVSTNMHTSYLACLVISGDRDAVAYLELAQDYSLGLATGTPELAAADSKTLQKYHPLQAMGYAPMKFGASILGVEGSINLRFPQAKLVAAYNLPPLIDRRAALKFGPIASNVSGLNHHLVNRLRTIRVDVINSAAATAAATAATVATAAAEFNVKKKSAGTLFKKRAAVDGGGSDNVDSDSDGSDSDGSDSDGSDSDGSDSDSIVGGDHEAMQVGPLMTTVDGITSRPWGESEHWYPFAGCRAKVDQYGTESSVIILNAIHKDRIDGWNLGLTAVYELAIHSGEIPDGVITTETAISTLVTEFERAFDAEPPTTPSEFWQLIIGSEPPAVDSYISKAVSRLGGKQLANQLKKSALLHGRAGVPRISFGAADREMWTTHAFQTGDAATVFWKTLKVVYRTDATPFERPRKYQRVALIALFRRIATDALIREPLICTPPTLKGYASATSRALPTRS